jgi:hypothetical protein
MVCTKYLEVHHRNVKVYFNEGVEVSVFLRLVLLSYMEYRIPKISLNMY